MAKNDKDKTKTRFSLVSLDFVAAIADVFNMGLTEDRHINGWQLLKWDVETEDAYIDALMRHLQAFRDTEKPSGKLLEHIAAVASNACILWWHTRDVNKKVAGIIAESQKATCIDPDLVVIHCEHCGEQLTIPVMLLHGCGYDDLINIKCRRCGGRTHGETTSSADLNDNATYFCSTCSKNFVYSLARGVEYCKKCNSKLMQLTRRNERPNEKLNKTPE